MGKPIIYAAPIGEGSAIVEKHSAGMIVEPENPRALAEAINFLSRDSVKLEKLALSSQDSAQYYSRDTHAKKCLQTLVAAYENY